MKQNIKLFALITILILMAACGEADKRTTETSENIKAFVGARIIDGTGKDPIEDGVLIIQAGRIIQVGMQSTIKIPEGAEIIDLDSMTLMPGLINTHGHVGNTLGLESGHYSEENILEHLSLYARYGVTTVNSLGGDGKEAAILRDQQDTSTLDRARIYIAGAVVTGETPEEAINVVNENAALGVDFIKIRVDDNLGTTEKMSKEIYQAVIAKAHELDLPLASHLYYLEDAKLLLQAGSDFIAHSIRDQMVDSALIELLRAKKVCYCPTLTRELSTFVYEDTPEFFDDPFFLRETDPQVIEQLKDPEQQQRVKESQSAQTYKLALEIAKQNLKILADAGINIAFGTDSGPPARFQGYFEHLEMELMAEAGLNPMQIIVSATGDAANCLGFKDLGTLEVGKWGDFMVLKENPLDDIKNSRSIESVWIAGNQISR
ncbi:MAG: amidohydrolase family protein [Proteobacteria bacterium]|nr:amidohydrolase family protein [Pseudomonadota bacterium]